jgi:hypothetical protein
MKYPKYNIQHIICDVTSHVTVIIKTIDFSLLSLFKKNESKLMTSSCCLCINLCLVHLHLSVYSCNSFLDTWCLWDHIAVCVYGFLQISMGHLSYHRKHDITSSHNFLLHIFHWIPTLILFYKGRKTRYSWSKVNAGRNVNGILFK